MQTPTKYNSYFLGPSLASSLFFIAVIFQGLYWGSLQMYPSNTVVRGRGSSFYWCWKKYKPNVNPDTKRLCSWYCQGEEEKEGIKNVPEFLIRDHTPQQSQERSFKPFGFQSTALTFYTTFVNPWEWHIHLSLSIYSACKLHHRSIYVKA